MGLFGYTDRTIDLLEELIRSPVGRMRPAPAEAFVRAYRKPMSKTMARIERHATPLGLIEVGGAANVAVVAQAVYGYLSDLRRGRHRDTLVELAIWAILVSRNSDAANMDRALSIWVLANADTAMPDLRSLAFLPDPPPLP